ncbi:hypothetical protein K1T71_001220 [Dendrolimus kikuchii]|uniref:Uncharacterized protein n=1 Tax=Dendrolimus kikuchii TaxID=765133 RepID=A0ACC1DH11_9NEOP|nr:hypothetical protein K1T71_001220 [Dendrolimus kikuchii]
MEDKIIMIDSFALEALAGQIKFMKMSLVGTDGQELLCRPYQAELEEIAIQKNTIIHLPTGSGKTIIAVRLIQRFRHEITKPWGEGGKRTFFLVNTVPLVIQQKKTIENYVHAAIGAYSSEDRVDYWDLNKWNEELSKHEIFVMTSQILADMFTHAYIRVEDINLLIFDECHHAVDDHPMHQVMTHFEGCPSHKQPRILGLTATLLNANVTVNQIEKKLKTLETTFHATIATVNELGEVLNFSTNPHEFLQEYRISPTPNIARIVIQKLNTLQDIVMAIKIPKTTGNHEIRLKPGQRDITTDPNKIVKEVNNMIVSMITFITEFGIYGGTIAILAYTILLEMLKRKALTKEEELLYKIVITKCIETRMMLLKAMEKDKGFEKITKHSSEKVLQLLNILKEYNPSVINAPGALLKMNRKRNPLCGIIFTRQRFTAKILYNLLKDVKECNPEFDFLKHDFIMGFNINPFKNTREQYFAKKSSQKALLKFKNQELNCLISTSVIEEGVDIPQCSLVLQYDAPADYRSYIQSKGRARSAESSFIILISLTEKPKFVSRYFEYQRIEKNIQSMLVGNTGERAAPTLEEIQEELYESDDVPPFVTPSGCRLSSLSAVRLLCRYCNTLNQDRFTTITPIWLQEKVRMRPSLQEHNVITVVMPLDCPVKEEVKGIPLLDLKSAKRSAALNVCKRLFEEGELHPITLLPNKFGHVDFEDDNVQDCFPNWKNESAENLDVLKIGTKKCVRRHKIQFPSYLKSTPSSNKQNYYLHLIQVKPAFPEPSDSRDKTLYDLIQNNEGYGFLTPKPLPKLCNFPIYVKVGEVMVTIKINYATVPLDEALFNLVKSFHYFIFDQVLDIAKKFLVFEGFVNCMYVVPVIVDKFDHNDYDINWDLMQTYTYIEPAIKPPNQIHKSMLVTQERYQNHVVTPWYRGSIPPDRYIVSKVLEHMTPRSYLDPVVCRTFIEYYETNHNLQLVDQNQPLLEVVRITSGMNCILPRAATLKHLTDKQKKLISQSQDGDRLKGFQEIFIPELCVKYEFPGLLWYKAMMLPTILHRVHMLLVAQELLTEIATSTKYGEACLRKGEEWMPVVSHENISLKSLLSEVEIPSSADFEDGNHVGTSSTTPKIVTMKDSLYKLQQQNLNKEYPWEESAEPMDVERNLKEATIMDIACYDEFISAPMTVSTNVIMSPKRVANTIAAIKAPPVKLVSKLAVLNKKPVGRGPELRDVLSALTTINSSDNFNLERLESLGDSFLKYASSVYLFHKFPKMNEGQLTNIKCRLVSNRNLYYAGERINLPGRMKVKPFIPRDEFLVPGFFSNKSCIRPTFLIGVQFPQKEILSGQLSKASFDSVQRKLTDCNSTAEIEFEGQAQNVMQGYIHAQAVSDKTVADCVEAIIGTYLLNGGPLAAVKVLEWFKIIPAKDNLAELLYKSADTPIAAKKATEEEINLILNYGRDDIERILNYKFKDMSLLLEAMSHPSYSRNRITRSYERLEFVGDAILDFLITTHIFENNPNLKPGEITDLRSALVNNTTFAAYTVKLGLHKLMCSNFDRALFDAIGKFVVHQTERNHEILEDIVYLVDQRECQIAEYIDVPKVLSDIFESLVGAMYLDCGGKLDVVWNVVYAIMREEIFAFSARIPRQPAAVLHENIHASPSFGTPKEMENELNKVLMPVTFTKDGQRTTVYGVGRNKSQAKRAAAKLALKILAI